MRIRSVLLALGLSLSLLPLAEAAGKCERLVATGHPDQPPYLWRDPQNPQQLIGASADLLKALGQAVGVRIDIRHGGKPAAAIEEVRSGRVDLLLGSPVAFEGLTQFDYLYPAYAERTVAVWTLPERAPLFTRLEDLARHRGQALERASYPAAVRERLGRLQPPAAPLNGAALQALLQGRQDYLLMELKAGQMLLEQQGAINSVVALQPALGSESLHLALSHNSACNDAWLRGQLARQLSELQRSGQMAQWLDDNRQRWIRQQAAAPKP